VGTIRLLLALSVAISHTPWWLTQEPGPYPIPGSYAVQCFFVLSGFYMALTWERKYSSLVHGARTFWLARAARLYPAYWLVVGVTLVALMILPGVPVALWFAQLCSLLSLVDYAKLAFVGLTNLVLLGQEIPGFMTLCDGTKAIGAIVPQGWSLGMEVAFYLLLPALVRVRSPWLIALAVVTGLSRVAAQMAGLPDNPWQIRFTPFELYFFVLGILGYRLWSSSRLGPALSTRRAGWIALVTLLVVTLTGRWPTGFTDFPLPWMSFTLGVIFALGAGSAFNLTARWRVDQWLGELSYPYYLWHTLAIGLVLGSLIPPDVQPGSGAFERLGVLSQTITLGLSILTVILVDRPLERWRQERIVRQAKRQPA
jgi:peptidoglycan/LPS O-acetylase OafA/YrhL